MVNKIFCPKKKLNLNFKYNCMDSQICLTFRALGCSGMGNAACFSKGWVDQDKAEQVRWIGGE